LKNPNKKESFVSIKDQQATVLQLPAQPTTAAEAEAQKRSTYAENS
jgi:hypothetical protein